MANTAEMAAAVPRPRVIRRTVALLLSASVALLVSLALVPSQAPAKSAAAASDDWPIPMHDLSRTNASTDTTITPANASSLRPLWTLTTGGPIVPAPIVTAGVAYFSSWDGNEYAVNAKTGGVLWKTFMGTLAVNPVCIPPKAGPSTPSVLVNGTILSGGADGYFYALNAQTGAVEWKVWTWGTGPPGAYDGHWSYSPALVLGNYAYIGVASLGDCPLVQGKMLKVDLTTHEVVQTLDFVPNGFVGGGTWTQPAYDPSNGLIYVSTATQNQPTEVFAQALVAIDPATMQIVDSWALPPAESIGDSDFGTTTTLYSAGGMPMLASINKNGIDYGMNRDRLSAGPVWRQNIALGGPCPTCDDGSVSSQAIGGAALYAAGGRGAVNGVVYTGTVRALNPATGAYIWQRPAPGDIIGALAYDNGMVLVPAGSVFEVLSAKTGARLYSYDTGSQIYAGPAVAGGMIYVSNIAGVMFAFGLPKGGHRVPADRTCPRGFTCQGIGGPLPPGHEASCAGHACAAATIRGGGRVTISAGGSGVGGSTDSFRLVSAPTNGADQVVARVVAQPAAGGSQVGVMIRQRNDPDSPYYALLEDPGHRLVVEYRTAFGGSTSEVYGAVGPRLPLYLMIQRHGDLFEAATSANGKLFSLVPGTVATVPMPAVSLGGVAVSSGAQGRVAAAVVSHVSVGRPTTTPRPYPSAHRCPAGFSCADIGDPALVGDQQYSRGTWTLRGGGFDIWATSDQFHLVWKPISGAASVSALVKTETDPSPNTKAGVMLRAGTGSAAAWYAVFVTPGLGIQVQYRDQTGNICAQSANPAGGAPVYLRVARSGNVFTAYTSSNGSSWSPINGSAVPLPNMTGRLLGGIALGSHDGQALATASFDDVSIG
jgi:outer membrane protein assembly factor BamB